MTKLNEYYPALERYWERGNLSVYWGKSNLAA